MRNEDNNVVEFATIPAVKVLDEAEIVAERLEEMMKASYGQLCYSIDPSEVQSRGELVERMSVVLDMMEKLMVQGGVQIEPIDMEGRI